MKYGYLEFRYNNRKKFKACDGDESDVTINIGDNIQSLAIRSLLNRLGINDRDIVGINRDELANYDGEPVTLVMNGCFYPHCFPLPPNVTPLFFGFNTDSVKLIRKHSALFKKYEPIGCRDNATKQLLVGQGITAYVTGCLTLTLEKRTQSPENGKVVIAYGRGAGEFPGSLLQYISPELLQRAAFVFQRQPVKVMPLGNAEVETADRIAREHLDFYAREAALIITPLLHVASPCMALGVPVILARRDLNSRFTAINRLTPLYTKENFRSIKWSPSVVDLEAIKQTMSRIVAQLLKGSPASQSDINFLSTIYDKPPISAGTPKSENRKSRGMINRLLHFHWLRK
ncbi:MAG: polysaccharide pyruvyl transferase family protein [Gloeobacteraceae cyanobacterium ES-bin-144]|nr:polysaccharide pyruvyl transferase family protein [Verrucomicrobiales bacterium]